jgi:hypothetical protein
MELTERRDLVIDRLTTDYARGAFEVEELERRLALVHTATSASELDALVTPQPLALVPAQHLRIVLGSIERVGPWDVPQRLTARVVCGNLVLDLRDARLAPGVTEIDVHVTMGNVEVIVPPGVEVDVAATSFLGHIEERTERTTTRATTTVRVVGRVKLGNLELSTLRLGETPREARWRRRSHRRWRRQLQRAAPWE